MFPHNHYLNNLYVQLKPPLKQADQVSQEKREINMNKYTTTEKQKIK